jgi:N,N'-diacetyllegionaminate synthase
MQWWEKMFTEEQWLQIVNQILKSGKKPMFLANDKKAIDFSAKFDPELVEIHSVCLNDKELLTYADNNLPSSTSLVLGVGGSDLYEIEHAVRTIHNREVILMHGFQNYPTQYENINLSKIRKIINLYPDFKHGYADHTAWNDPNNLLATLLIAANDMHYIEKHVTITPGEERLDWQAAISIDLFNQITESLKTLEKINGNGNLALNEGELSYSVFGPNKKAAVLLKDKKSGETLSKNDFSFKRTKQITDISQIDILKLIGKNISKDLTAGHCLCKNDFN